MPPQQQNQYDFILNNKAKPPRGPLLGGSVGARVAVIAVLFIIFVIAAGVINSFLSKDSQAQNQRLIEIAHAQTEIIRVSAIAKDEKNAKDTTTRNFALNTSLSFESSQQQVKKLLAARGVSEKSLDKRLAASKNPKTDAALDEATKNSRFDKTFLTLMHKQLTDYQKLLQAAYPGSTPKERATLTALSENARLLAANSKTEANQP